MSHRLDVVFPPGSPVEWARIFHNSDWSGDVRLAWLDEKGHREVELPGEILLRMSGAAAARHVVNGMISALEQVSPDIDLRQLKAAVATPWEQRTVEDKAALSDRVEEVTDAVLRERRAPTLTNSSEDRQMKQQYRSIVFAVLRFLEENPR